MHEVPVAVVPQRLWPDYQEPKMPEIDVSTYLPSLKSLKTHIDHMKNLSPHLVSVSMCSKLCIPLVSIYYSVCHLFTVYKWELVW